MGLFGVPLDQGHPRPAGQPARSVARRAGFTTIDQAAGEILPRQRDDVVVVNVAGHRQDHALRGVAANVKGAQLVSGHGRDRIDAADHRPAHRMVTEHRGQEGIAQAVLGIVVAHGDLLEHDITFQFDVGGRAHTVEHDIGHQVDGHLQVVIEHMRVVAGVLLGGERVQLTADRVHRLGDLDRCASRGGLEQQVLQEVGGAGHGGTLVAGTDVDPQADRGRTYRGHPLGDDPQAARQHGAPDGRAVLSCRRSRHQPVRLPWLRPPRRRRRRPGPGRSCRGCRYRRSPPAACRPP